MLSGDCHHSGAHSGALPTPPQRTQQVSLVGGQSGSVICGPPSLHLTANCTPARGSAVNVGHAVRQQQLGPLGAYVRPRNSQTTEYLTCHRTGLE